MIQYDSKIDRARNSKTGRFVSFHKAHLSSIFRKQYEPVMLKRKVMELEKGISEKEKIIKQMQERKVEWKLVEEIFKPVKEESVINMYIRLHDKISKEKYEDMIEEIEEMEESNKRKRLLQNYYRKYVISKKR